MKLRKLLWFIPIIGLAFSLTNCASTSKASESKSNEAKTSNPTDGKGTVFLYRTGRAVGAAG